MRKLCLFFLLLTANSQISFAQQNPISTPYSQAIANTSVAYTEEWACFHNPAILANVKSPSIGLNYDNRFELKELSTVALQAASPTKHINCGLGLSHFGTWSFSEMQVGLALARSFGKRFSMGVQLNCFAVQSAVGSRSAFTLQVGLLSQPTKKLSIGFHAYNPSQAIIDYEDLQKRIPSIFSLGSAYHISPNLLFLTQLDKELEYPLLLRTGFEYRVYNSINLKAGVYGAPLVPCFGTSFHWKSLVLGVNFERHPALGINSHCNIIYKL